MVMIIIDIIIILLYFHFVPQNSNPRIYCSAWRNSPVSFFPIPPSMTQPSSITCALCLFFLALGRWRWRPSWYTSSTTSYLHDLILKIGAKVPSKGSFPVLAFYKLSSVLFSFESVPFKSSSKVLSASYLDLSIPVFNLVKLVVWMSFPNSSGGLIPMSPHSYVEHLNAEANAGDVPTQHPGREDGCLSEGTRSHSEVYNAEEWKESLLKGEGQ